MANTKVTGDVIANGTISTVHIADDAITAAKLDSTATGITFADLAVSGNSTLTGYVGIGITPNASYSKLQIKTPSSAYGLDLVGRDAGSNSESQITFWNAAQSSVLAAIYNITSNLYFYTNGDNRMIINSSGDVGIGITSPGAKLHINELTANTPVALTIESASWDSTLKLKNGNGTWEILNDYTGLGTNATLAFYNSGYRMVIDNTGNVGIGTTSPNTKLNINGASAHLNFTGSNNRINFSGYRAIEGSHTGSLLQIGESYNNISLYGNVGIGTTSPTNKFVVRDTGSSFNSTVHPSTATIISKELTDNAYHSILQLVAVRQSLTTGKDSQGYLGFSTIDDSNNQGMKDAGRIAIVNETTSARNSATALSFWTNPGGTTDTVSAVEKMRISSSGRITMPGLDGKTQVHPDVSYRTSDGELFYQTSSERYKTDIVNLESSLNKIDSLRPVRFTDINTNEPGFGLIAEETNEIIPEVVFSKDDQIEGISYSNLTPFLIKAIQELKADNDSLRARIEILENN